VRVVLSEESTPMDFLIECITRPIDDDQPAGQYDQLQIHVDRQKPTQAV